MSAAQPEAPGSRVLELSQVSLPRLLFSLLHQRFTGTVVVDQPEPMPGRRTLWFRGGMPVFTDWSEPTEVLGRVLIGQQAITEDTLLHALETMARQGGFLGQTLQAMGRLTSPQLAEGLRRQCARKLATLSGLRVGRVTVTPVEHGVGVSDGLLPVNSLEVIHNAVALHYDEARVASEMGAGLQAHVQATPALNKYVSHFRFRATDKAGLQALVHGTQLASMAVLEGMTGRRAAQLVYLLWACQMLQIGSAAAAPPPRPTGTAPPPGFETNTYAPPPPVASPPRPTPTPAAPTPAVRPPSAASPAPRSPAPASSTPVPPEPPRANKKAPPKARPLPIDIPGVDPTFAAELLALEQRVADRAHPFALFELPLDAARKDVRAAWGELSRKFHPDALASHGLEALRGRVNEVFAALSEAHQVLADNDARTKLAEQIQAGDYGSDASDATATARAAFEAELMARDGEKLMRSNNFVRALERLHAAAAIHEDPGTKASIAWCTFQVSGKGNQDASLANAQLQQIVEAYPNIPAPHYYRGFVLMTLDHLDLAITEFSEAYRLDPRLIDAERQARALRLKRKADRTAAAQPPPRKGLRGLFGKK